jgi:Raf kinase inhibitor-like YbhB/YbcL family protein
MVLNLDIQILYNEINTYPRTRMMKRLLTLLCVFLLFTSCTPTGEPVKQESVTPALITLTSPAFSEGAAIPEKYSCDGEDISPALEWSNPPDGTQSFALIMDDPDAPLGDWVHWVLYNIPANVRSLPENISSDAALPDGSQHGTNGWKDYGYGGPCPPRGTHRYFFKLYALDSLLDAEPGLSKQKLLDAMQGHILAEGQLMGTYTR